MINFEKILSKRWTPVQQERCARYEMEAKRDRKSTALYDSDCLLMESLQFYDSHDDGDYYDPKHPDATSLMLDVYFPELIYRLHTRMKQVEATLSDRDLSDLKLTPHYERRVKDSALLVRRSERGIRKLRGKEFMRYEERVQSFRVKHSGTFDRVYMTISARESIAKDPRFDGIINQSLSPEQEALQAQEFEHGQSRADFKQTVSHFSDQALTDAVLCAVGNMELLDDTVPGEPTYLSTLFFSLIPELVERLNYDHERGASDLKSRQRYIHAMKTLLSDALRLIAMVDRQLNQEQSERWPEKDLFRHSYQTFLNEPLIQSLTQERVSPLHPIN